MNAESRRLLGQALKEQNRQTDPNRPRTKPTKGRPTGRMKPLTLEERMKRRIALQGTSKWPALPLVMSLVLMAVSASAQPVEWALDTYTLGEPGECGIDLPAPDAPPGVYPCPVGELLQVGGVQLQCVGDLDRNRDTWVGMGDFFSIVAATDLTLFRSFVGHIGDRVECGRIF